MKIHVKTTFYNKALLEARKAAGMTQKELAQLIGMPTQYYSYIERLRRPVSPSEASDIASALLADEDDLFPPQTRQPNMLKRPGYRFDIEIERLDELPSGDMGLMIEEPGQGLERKELGQAVHNAVEKLSRNERAILNCRFGLDGGEPLTLEEAGKVYGITRERVRQIEARALKRLRHPSVSRRLRGHMNTDDH